MGFRNRKSNRKLSIKKETLRDLQLLRTLSEDELRAAIGGRSGTCSEDCPPAPSHCGC